MPSDFPVLGFLREDSGSQFSCWPLDFPFLGASLRVLRSNFTITGINRSADTPCSSASYSTLVI